MRLNNLVAPLMAGWLATLVMGAAQAQPRVIERQPEFVVEQLAEGFSIPWGMAFVDSNRLLISERRGDQSAAIDHFKEALARLLQDHPL